MSETLRDLLNPATRAMVVAATSGTSAAQVDELRRSLQQISNWENFTAHLERHRMSSIVEPSLKHYAADLVPPKLLKAISTRNKLQKLRGELATAELLRLTALLNEHKLPTISYKGPVAAKLYYGGIGRRPFSDLDFLVRPQDIDQVVQLIGEQGYVSPVPADSKTQQNHLRYQKEFSMTRGGLTVEPHFSLTPSRIRFPIDYDALWSAARPLTLTADGQTGSVLVWAPEHAALIYAVIGGMLEWRRLPKISDFARLALAHPQLDWAQVTDLAVATGTSRILSTSVLLAQGLFATEFPAQVYNTAKQDRTALAIAERVTQDANEALTTRNWLPNHPRIVTQTLWRMRERPADKFRYLIDTATVPSWNQVQRVPLPQALMPLHRILTPLIDYVGHPAVRLIRRVTKPTVT